MNFKVLQLHSIHVFLEITEQASNAAESGKNGAVAKSNGSNTVSFNNSLFYDNIAKGVGAVYGFGIQVVLQHLQIVLCMVMLLITGIVEFHITGINCKY